PLPPACRRVAAPPLRRSILPACRCRPGWSPDRACRRSDRDHRPPPRAVGWKEPRPAARPRRMVPAERPTSFSFDTSRRIEETSVKRITVLADVHLPRWSVSNGKSRERVPIRDVTSADRGFDRVPAPSYVVPQPTKEKADAEGDLEWGHTRRERPLRDG